MVHEMRLAKTAPQTGCLESVVTRNHQFRENTGGQQEEGKDGYKNN